MYNTNWLKFVRNNLTARLRRDVMVGYANALLAPLRVIDGWFDTFRDEIAEQYRWNGTKASLEKLLNDRFDPVERRIYIEEVEKLPALYMKSGNELADAYFTQTNAEVEHHFHLPADLNASATTHYEMKVMIPLMIGFVPEEVMELLEVYRYGGMRPAIFIFEDGYEAEIPTDYLSE